MTLSPPESSIPDSLMYASRYGYNPSLAFGIIGIVAFAISSIAHTYQAYRYRMMWCSVLAIGGITEVIGYAGRTWSHYQDYDSNPFLMQTVRNRLHDG